ncbi:Cold shock family protein [Ketogulonicigenium vulgare WSH-001]|uniref:Cold shock family protein n=2 Tax=Ketogulonicigenium vulgare TaxID=92945 RepID=F9Y9I3_KETVW|nr:Cold shock family protein [Ketogulonicigenium vulgare WSH-001]
MTLGQSASHDYESPLRAAERQGRMAMPNGTVKWFNTTKGYGFIAPEGGGKDVFVHISAVEQAGLTGLSDDQKVTFDLIEGRDGRQMAGNLKPE